ncbi:MAG: hypothetical protein GY839_04445 [candidate division Zixibacteria bacterium]|nr:hypothetical protein [candidate division Zixibacteria bacterium]
MKSKLTILLILLLAAPSAFAIGDIAIGPFYGMAMPVANDAAKSGMMYGVQAKVALVPMLAVGAHYNSRSYGNPTIESELLGEIEFDGGSVTSMGLDAFLGKIGGTVGPNFYFAASYSTFKWKRDIVEEVSQSALAIGPGLEIVLPMKVGIEGRAMFEVASTGEDGSWKALMWYIGVNYHISLTPGPM